MQPSPPATFVKHMLLHNCVEQPGPLDTPCLVWTGYCMRNVSTPKQKCIGWPEQKYISDAGKKAPELGVFSLEVKPGWDYPRARPSWRGANGACSD